MQLTPFFNILEKGTFVFCNFNQAVKIDAAIFDVWMKVLKRVPNSVMWLINLAEDAIPVLKSHAQIRGVNPDKYCMIHFLKVGY